MVKFPTPGLKIRSNAPRQGWIQWSNAPPPVRSSSESRILFGLKISVTSVFLKCHKQEHDVFMLNIGSTMITEGSGSCFSVALFLCATRHEKNRGNESNSPPLWCCGQTPHQYVAARQIPPSPGKGEGQMPGAGGRGGGGGGRGMCKFRIHRYIIIQHDNTTADFLQVQSSSFGIWFIRLTKCVKALSRCFAVLFAVSESQNGTVKASLAQPQSYAPWSNVSAQKRQTTHRSIFRGFTLEEMVEWPFHVTVLREPTKGTSNNKLGTIIAIWVKSTAWMVYNRPDRTNEYDQWYCSMIWINACQW